MLKFKNHTPLHEAAKNTHMTHIEDLILDGGVKGARQAILALRSLRDMLSGNAKSPVDVTVKWDGAPAVFAGVDPGDGKFFVAKKGIFNANPKIYKSHEDIKADTSGDLSKKLILAFDELSKLGITNVIQGDFMPPFSRNSRIGHACWTGTNNSNPFSCLHCRVIKQGFMSSSGVNQTADRLTSEGMV